MAVDLGFCHCILLSALSTLAHYYSWWRVVIVTGEMLPPYIMLVAAYGIWASPKTYSAFYSQHGPRLDHVLTKNESHQCSFGSVWKRTETISSTTSQSTCLIHFWCPPEYTCSIHTKWWKCIQVCFIQLNKAGMKALLEVQGSTNHSMNMRHKQQCDTNMCDFPGSGISAEDSQRLSSKQPHIMFT